MSFIERWLLALARRELRAASDRILASADLLCRPPATDEERAERVKFLSCQVFLQAHAPEYAGFRKDWARW